jgi:general secretion pathway protein H
MDPMASQPSHDRAAKRQRTQRGLTLLELLVVLTVAALATAAVSLSLRDPDQRALQREGERLAALLESGRSWSRNSGQVLRWTAGADGFAFEGHTPKRAPEAWQTPGIEVQWTQVAQAQALVLGPEPIIAPQAITLRLRQQQLTLSSDGLRAFEVRSP